MTRNRSVSWGWRCSPRTARPHGRSDGPGRTVRSCPRHRAAPRPAPGDLVLISPGSTAPSPDEPGGGVAPAQPLPAAEPASHHDHHRTLLGQCRPSSSPWPATAAPARPPAARCHAPDTADRRNCRTAGREYGRPGNARRRSAECTDRCRQASASKCSGGPCRAPSRARWRSPRAGASSGAPRRLTALACCQPPTNPPSRRARPGRSTSLPHRTPRRYGLPGRT
jgi:hypothetical protein